MIIICFISALFSAFSYKNALTEIASTDVGMPSYWTIKQRGNYRQVEKLLTSGLMDHPLTKLAVNTPVTKFISNFLSKGKLN